MQNKKSDIKPYQIVVIILFFLAALSIYFWLGGERAKYKGVSYLHYQHDQLSMVLGNELLRVGEDGEYSAVSLEDFGVSNVTGGISYLHNGDILLIDQPAGLKLCSLDEPTKTCSSVPQGESFGKSFRTQILDNGQLIIANTSKHRVVWYDDNGDILGEMSEGFKYPNQISLVNQTLYVANTQGNSISKIELTEPGDIDNKEGWDQWSLKQGVAADLKHIYPTEFIKLEKSMAVLSHPGLLSFGNIYLFDESGSLTKAFDLPEGADIYSIALFKGDIIGSDFAQHKLYRFSKQGEYLGELYAPEVQERLKNNALNYQRYSQFIDILFIVSGFVFVILVLLGLWLEYMRSKTAKNHMAFQRATANLNTLERPTIDEPGIHWIKPTKHMLRDKKAVKWLLNGVMFLLIILMCVTALTMEESKLSPLLLGMPFVFLVLHALMFFLIKRVKQPKLGVYGQWIILIDGKERIGMVEANTFKYTKAMYIVGDVHIAVQNGYYSQFDGDEIEKYLAPLLPHAVKLTQIQVCSYLWEKRDKPFLLSLVLLPILLVFYLYRF